ncbi:WD repeat-containing protein 74 [Dorcoceras hygrometricum]|uniref:WD repeat-containing protein 74 n=1 Tax=Dorcoceras hygrometricum TaxID=472368 RepID=A0A2Z7CJK4_9LAMI|nr:WD repeat-containing protein 74 [Dorcoceras hygrometricum]
MPRTTTVESPGCPPLRALTCDVLGLVKVIEARKNENTGAAKMVERWGDPDSSKCVLAASILDRESDPIEVISTVNGNLRVQIPSLCETATSLQDDSIMGLHLLEKHTSEPSSRSCMLHVCTRKGYASLESIDVTKSSAEFIRDPSTTTWNISGSGEILLSRVDESEKYALYGGKGVEVNLWDLSNNTKIWVAKSPPKNSLGIFTPTWFTSATFLSKDDHRKFVAGTNSHQVRLYDISSQRRPIMSIEFRETPIKSIAEDFDGHTIYVGNGSGDLGSIDMRTGKLLGCFIGKCSGSLRSIARHPELPVLASCGLDSYLRFWDIHSRQLLSAVFLKQPLTNVFFDSHYRGGEINVGAREPQGVDIVEEVPLCVKRKMSTKEHKGSKKMSTKKSSKKSRVAQH